MAADATPSAEPPLRVVVADDEPTALQRLTRLLSGLPGVAVVAECGSGREALGAVEAQRPDVVFLDIAMPGIDGMAVARQLDGEAGPLVVFVTAYDTHAVDAFRVHAADFVVKPVDRERLADAVEHARRAVRRRRAERGPDAGAGAAPVVAPRLTLRDGYRVHLVPVPDIAWVESYGNYARVHTTGGRFIHRATMAQLAGELAPHGFARIHRTAIVNAARVTRVRPCGNGQYEVALDTGARLRISRTYRAQLDALRGAAPSAVPPSAPPGGAPDAAAR
jgi:two-component system LytT family response regulator